MITLPQDKCVYKSHTVSHQQQCCHCVPVAALQCCHAAVIEAALSVQVAAAPGKPSTPGPPGRAGELPPGPPLEVPHNLQRIRTAVTPPLQPQEQAALLHAPVTGGFLGSPCMEPLGVLTHSLSGCSSI